MSNTIQEKLAYLEETKGLIKKAIAEKGVSVSEGDTFRSYADKITSIQSGGSIAGAPSGIKFGYSTFTTVPTEIIPYLEAQTDLSGIFQRCQNLTTVPLFDTSRATTMEDMFDYCTNLQTVPLFDTSSVTNMRYVFFVCSNLQTVPLFDTSSVNNMSGMFSDCESLTSVPHFDTSSVTDMGYMFRDCYSLTSVPQFDTSSVNDMEYMFSYCTKLTSVPLLNVSSVTKMSSMFSGCSSLTNLGGLTGLKANLNLGRSPLLTIESVMNIINYAENMTSSPKTLTLSQEAFNRLTQEQITTANKKGWNIAIY